MARVLTLAQTKQIKINIHKQNNTKTQKIQVHILAKHQHITKHNFRTNILKFSAISCRIVLYLDVSVELTAAIFRVGSLLVDCSDAGASK